MTSDSEQRTLSTNSVWTAFPFFFLVVLFAFFGTTTCTACLLEMSQFGDLPSRESAAELRERVVEESLPADLIILLGASGRDVPS
jgi:hypothetical protein